MAIEGNFTVLFVLGFGPIVRDVGAGRRLYEKDIGISFKEESGGYRTPLSPLGNRLGVDAMTPSQRSQALLTMLDRSTNRCCRRGTRCRTCPIVLPSTLVKNMHHPTPGPNI